VFWIGKNFETSESRIGKHVFRSYQFTVENFLIYFFPADFLVLRDLSSIALAESLKRVVVNGIPSQSSRRRTAASSVVGALKWTESTVPANW